MDVASPEVALVPGTPVGRQVVDESVSKFLRICQEERIIGV